MLRDVSGAERACIALTHRRSLLERLEDRVVLTDGVLDENELALRALANSVYSAINEGGDRYLNENAAIHQSRARGCIHVIRALVGATWLTGDLSMGHDGVAAARKGGSHHQAANLSGSVGKKLLTSA